MRNDGRNAKELEDKYAFLYTVDRDEVCIVYSLILFLEFREKFMRIS